MCGGVRLVLVIVFMYFFKYILIVLAFRTVPEFGGCAMTLVCFNFVLE